jgi:hypothetical protein
MKIPKAPKLPSASTLQSANLVKASPSNRPQPLPTDRAVTLDDLRRRAQIVSADTRELAFMALDDAQRMEHGRSVDSAVVITAATDFAAGAYTTFDHLSDADRAKVVGACPEFVDLLVHETVALQAQKFLFDAQAARGEVNRASRRAAARKSLREGITLRDQVYGALRNVTPLHHRDALDAAVGTAATAAELDVGMRRVATLLRARLDAATSGQRAALARVGLTAAQADALDAGAAHALAAEQEATGAPAHARVTQRELDLGDGAVVHLVGVIYRAFREATAALPTLVVPPLGELARFFVRAAPKAAPAPTPTPADPVAPHG